MESDSPVNIIPTKLIGDCRQTLKQIPDGSVHVCITSPPYFKLREYLPKGHWNKEREIGQEENFEDYVENLIEAFREVRRLLRDDGTLWVNLGDRYTNAGRSTYDPKGKVMGRDEIHPTAGKKRPADIDGLKKKELCLVPQRIAMQAPYIAPCCVKAEVDRAWLAAMIDGEGCIGIRRFDSFKDGEQKQDGFVVLTVVSNNDVELLEKCVQITGFGSINIKQAANTTDGRGIVSRRDNYGWRLDGNKAVDVIRAAYPYLIAKRKQACVAYTLDVLNKSGREARGNGPVPKELQEKRAFLKELINKLNQRERVDVPSWIEEPKPKIEPGWYLRSMIPWIKRNAIPESVKDRPVNALEYVFMFSKTCDYYYDRYAVLTPSSPNTHPRAAVFPHRQERDQDNSRRRRRTNPKAALDSIGSKQNPSFTKAISNYIPADRNRRNTDWFLESWQGMLTDDDGYPVALVVNPKGTTIAHFAAYPPKLVEPIILCSTSQAGCCGKCGRPLERVVESVSPDLDKQKSCGGDELGFYTGHARKDYNGAGVQNASDVKRRILAGMTFKKTIDWVRLCDCDPVKSVPCTVLDPFSGTACTLMVATNLGRHSIGCDINEKYIKSSDARDSQGALSML